MSDAEKSVYRVTVTVRKTYIAEKRVTFDVDALDEEAAKDEARDMADDKADIRMSWDAELDETDTDINSIECIAGPNNAEKATPRCDKTQDMFGGCHA